MPPLLKSKSVDFQLKPFRFVNKCAQFGHHHKLKIKNKNNFFLSIIELGYSSLYCSFFFFNLAILPIN